MNLYSRVSVLSIITSLSLAVAAIMLPVTSGCTVQITDPLGYCRGE